MAQLREGSVIKKAGGDEVIATVNDIPEIPTSLPANGGNADTVNGFTVEANVPANAKFTDTTYSEITTSEIDAGTSSTLRTISGRRVKYILDKIQGWLNNKVDKVTGKGLSTEDYTTAEKDKLAGIESGANKYTHPSTHPASMITESSTKRFVSDAEKTAWNGKQNALGYTPVNKAGDTMTGTLIIDGKDLPSGTDIVTMKRGSGTNRFVLETQDKAMQAFMEAGAAVGLMGTITASDFRIRTNYTDRVSIRGSDGNVGIGTTSTTQKLDVNGKIRMRTQTATTDGDDIVATKKYVDDNAGGDVYHIGATPPTDTSIFWIDTSS